MRGAEILAEPDRGLRFVAAELVRAQGHLSASEAVDRALAELRRRGAEPSFAGICAARSAAVEEQRARLGPPVERNNLAGLRLAARDGEVVPATSLIDDHEDDGDAEAWQPPTLADPAMWRDPVNMPPGLRGLAFVDFDPAASSPPPAWLAKGLLPRSGIGLLYGESGGGKSFAAIHAVLCVAWGLPLFGAKTKPGAVLYVAAEGGKSVVRRFAAANAALGGAVAAANLCRPAGTEPLARAPIRIVTDAPDLSRDGDPAPLVRTIRGAAEEFERDGHRLAMVVIDTWHAALGGGDENSAADAGHALKPLIAEAERGDFLTLIVHHPGKDGERGARGSNALPAAADAIIAISVPGHEGAKAKPSTAVRRAMVTKMRDGEAGGEFAYRLNVVEVGRDEDGDPVTTCTVVPCDAVKVDGDGLSRDDRLLIEVIKEAASEGSNPKCRFDEVRLRFKAHKEGLKPEAFRKSWSRAIRAARETGRIDTDENDYFIWISGPPEA